MRDEAPVPDRRYVLIASNAYSGSTLLCLLLGAHPQIATVSDVSGTRRAHRMGTFRCSCGLRMLDDPFWLAVRDGMRSRGWSDFELPDFRLGFDYGASRTFNRIRAGTLRWQALETLRDVLFSAWPPDRQRMREIGRRTADFASVVAELHDAMVFVDASKERLRARYLARYLPLDLRVIHLVRDVRAVVASTREHASGRLKSVELIAARWKATNQAIARSVAEIPPPNRMLVRYEQLCRDPDAMLAAIHRFCGVEPVTPVSPAASPVQHVLGNRMRLVGSAEVHLDERWRERLSREEQARAVRAAGLVFRDLYPLLAEQPGSAAR